ncbi:hypothetical protein [Paenibacillus sp. NEAU-GSW1]|uniref:DUF6985 domain-containing protein n=1 Tax=Paenibacillus sp. NEAU-GSW1 TaxID=2682486 RepID=UPI0012E273DC|nr:hypothetical protein [Paenibacillus sp. NEAU-GSW1]MUT66856.1 hypothetical protein [Paenibacillus sp. NEAU-GSW1]
MLKNIIQTGNSIEGEFYFELFKRDIRFTVEDNVGISYVEQCVTYINSLSESVIVKLCEASIRYCNEFLEEVGEEQLVFLKPMDVLSKIEPIMLCVPDPEGRDIPVLDLELNCEWEIEHGMEWIVRENEVLYVGPYYGENPWGDYAVKKNWNYA